MSPLHAIKKSHGSVSNALSFNGDNVQQFPVSVTTEPQQVCRQSAMEQSSSSGHQCSVGVSPAAGTDVVSSWSDAENYKGTEGVKKAPGRVVIQPLDNIFVFTTFVVAGTAAMAFWNTLVNALYSIRVYLYPDSGDISNSLTAVYTTMSLISTASLIWFHVLNIRLLFVGAAGFALCSLGVAAVCNWAAVSFLSIQRRTLGQCL